MLSKLKLHLSDNNKVNKPKSMAKLQKKETIYIDTSEMCAESVNEMIFILGQKDIKFVSISVTDVEDNADYFLAISPTENICYMDCNASNNIHKFKDAMSFLFPQ